MTKVFNPMGLPEVLGSSLVMRRPAPVTARVSADRVKKNLFGIANKEETKKVFEREMEAHVVQVSNKYGFDFKTGKPKENGQYQWERVPPTAPVYFPRMVTLTGAAHVVSPQTATDSENLLDERAERENRITLSLDRPLSFPESSAACMEIEVRGPKRTLTLVLRSSDSSGSDSASTQSTKRQRKITDCFKERKRLSNGILKASPAKKARSMHSPPPTTATTTRAAAQLNRSLSQ